MLARATRTVIAGITAPAFARIAISTTQEPTHPAPSRQRSHQHPSQNERFTLTSQDSRQRHPLTSNRYIGHQVWLYINRERPDIPEVNLHSPHIQLQGYTASEPDEHGNMPRIHGVRCTQCGSPDVTFAARSWANCRTCGKGQAQSEAALCSSHCEECSP
ncbi:hypothetical protein CP970_40615 [Streptomyces kanamyceticus]|uniref:Uncharacterized protein n=1 Tax=Streptomyces kanamyceticus TaxID=1967 RepID=A0A5J6GQJ7_STRKN|nr:hypothetical protein CP970_40615 [Streptomyces kanamyceticus]